MEKIKAGVIGTGALGRHHSRLYAQNPDVEMAGIFDVNTENAKKVGAEFNLPVFTMWQTLAEKCDVLSVAVPANYHASTALPLLALGKNVLMEKPLAASVKEGEALLEAAKKNQLCLGVGHVERFNPAFEYLMAQNPKAEYAVFRRFAKYPPARPGLPPRGTEVSVVLDLMIHDIDLALTLFGGEPIEIRAKGGAVLSPGCDWAEAELVFAGGKVARLSASRMAVNPERTALVQCGDIQYLMDFGNPVVKINHPDASRTGFAVDEVTLPAKNALYDELADFVAAVAERRAPRVTGEAALAALRAAEEIDRQIREK